MRKLFRFKYEPCNKTCYAYCSKLMEELRALPEQRRVQLVTEMVAAHNKLCDNPQFSFGVDMDDQLNVFVAHLRTPVSTELYSSRYFADAVEEVCQAVMLTNIPQISGECTFGSNGAEDLGHEILRFCTDIGFSQLEERHCECKTHVA
jgi:hypothetical protein